jgi:UDP-glucose 4-epimerase
MKVLVTGGAGFIGSHIVDKLIQESCQVFVLDNLSTGLSENINKAATFVQMDICNSLELSDLFKREQFDYVVHQAAQTSVPESVAKPDSDCQVNILGSVNVLEACRKTAVKRIVAASSAAVYGNVTKIPVLENTPKCPTSFYGASKLTVEQYLALYSQIYNLEYVALRYANVYGERQGINGEGGVINIFAQKIQANEAITIYGDGTQTRDFVYAGDVALANFQALTTSNFNTAYNVSTQIETSIHALIALMEQTTALVVKKQYMLPREGDIYRSSLSNTMAAQLLNWKPTMPFPEGITKTYQTITTKQKYLSGEENYE